MGFRLPRLRLKATLAMRRLANIRCLPYNGPVNGTNNRTGLALLVGAGPGDEQLITLAGLSWLRQAQVVIYDRLGAAALVSQANPSAELIYVGKGPSTPTTPQARINELLVEHCRQGKLVVRLKGGDPFIFGRGGEEIEALQQAGIPFRIVPGITAGVAASAYAGIPLTDRRFASSVAFVTGHEDPAKEASSINWSALAGIDTLVFYMGVASLAQIAANLQRAGKPSDTPAAIVENAALPRQRVITGTLADIAQLATRHAVEAPAVTIVGKVVSLRERMAWFEHLPLHSRRVLVTRTRQQASALSAQLRNLGADVIEAPTIEIEPPQNIKAVDDAIARLGQFDWLVLTSPSGVTALFERMDALGMDARSFCGVKIAAVGQATADALAVRFIHANLVPESFTTADLGGLLMGSVKLMNKRLLLARADIASPELTGMLRQSGAIVEDVSFYRTACPASLPADAAEALAAGAVDWITFTSSSTVDNFIALTARTNVSLGAVKLAAIGPVTAKTLRSHGLSPTVVASPHTIDALVEAIVDYENSRPQGQATTKEGI